MDELLNIAMYTLPTKISWRLPPLVWAPSYDLDMLTGDFIAGVTTALTVIPQGIGMSSSYKLWFKIKKHRWTLSWEKYLCICRVCSIGRAPLTIWALCKHRPGVHLLSTRHYKAKPLPILQYLNTWSFYVLSALTGALYISMCRKLLGGLDRPFSFLFSLGHIVQLA